MSTALNRRTAFASLAAAGAALVVAPQIASAAHDDADVFAAIDRLMALFAEREALAAQEAASKRLDLAAAERAYSAAVTAADEAADNLVNHLRPRTVAGLRAVAAALRQIRYFESETGEALLEMLLDSPALSDATSNVRA